MKYKTKIVPHNDGYIGYVYQGEDAVFTSMKHKDATLVSRELTKYISAQPNISTQQPYINPTVTSARTLPENVAPVHKNAIPAPLPSSVLPQPPPPAYLPPAPPSSTPRRRCCGRG